MKEVFIELARFSPPGSKNYFVGPLDNKSLAQEQIDLAIKSIKSIEIVQNDGTPKNLNKAIHVRIVTMSEARRKGLKNPKLFGDKKNTLLGNTIPEKIPNGHISEDYEQVKVTDESEAEKEIRQFESEKESETLIDQRIVFDKITDFVIVTHYSGTVQWLAEKMNITGTILSRVTSPDQIRGKVVIGTLPNKWQCYAEKIGNIELQRLRQDQLGRPMSFNDLEDAGANLVWYKVEKLS